MTTPKEALEFYADPIAWKKQHDLEDSVRVPDFYEETSFGDMAKEAIASLEGDAVERVARIIAGPLCDATNGEHLIAVQQGGYRFCTQCGETISKRAIGIVEARNKARAILATGLVPDEAAIRADEREKCAARFRGKDIWTGEAIAAAIRSGGAQ